MSSHMPAVGISMSIALQFSLLRIMLKYDGSGGIGGAGGGGGGGGGGG